MIPCRKMDGNSSICQTTFNSLLSLKVRRQTRCQSSSTQNLLVIACWSQVCSWDLQSVLNWLDDTGKHTLEKAFHGNNYIHVILLPLTVPAEVKDNCVTAACTSQTFFLVVVTSGQQCVVMFFCDLDQ